MPLNPSTLQVGSTGQKRTALASTSTPTYFAHPKANDGFTLSHADQGIRDFWIQHGIASRRIAEAIGKALGDEVVNNHWIPDGAKDHPADRWTPARASRGSLRRDFRRPLGHWPGVH